jgi:hypothetical protein
MLVLHVIVTLSVARWTAFSSAAYTVGTVLLLLPLQTITLVCLAGMTVAVGAPNGHWTRRHLLGLNIGAMSSLLLWSVGYSEGPIFRVLTASGSAAWPEIALFSFMLGAMVVWCSLRLVRQTQPARVALGSGGWQLQVMSVIVFLGGSVPWLISSAQLAGANGERHQPGPILLGAMEFTTLAAVCLAALALLNRARFAACIAIAEAVAVPVFARIAHW